MLNTVEIAGKLRELRVSHQLTQDALAEKIYVSRQAVSQWEKGESLPSITSCILLMEIYEVSLDELFCLNSPKEDSVCLENVLKGRFNDCLTDILYRFSKEERWRILRAVKERQIDADIEELYPFCSKEERAYLKGGLQDETETDDSVSGQ